MNHSIKVARATIAEVAFRVRRAIISPKCADCVFRGVHSGTGGKRAHCLKFDFATHPDFECGEGRLKRPAKTERPAS